MVSCCAILSFWRSSKPSYWQKWTSSCSDRSTPHTLCTLRPDHEFFPRVLWSYLPIQNVQRWTFDRMSPCSNRWMNQYSAYGTKAGSLQLLHAFLSSFGRYVDLVSGLSVCLEVVYNKCTSSVSLFSAAWRNFTRFSRCLRCWAAGTLV